ncbi:MAG TPA: hypothetical protein VHQ65_08865 [Thermoanaerobaculia bacterium]|nr:hypothetical protein [Thermoanaerobaculia bacterium]
MRSCLLLTVLAFTLAAVPAAAQPADDSCWTVCRRATPCDRWCVDRERVPWVVTTCGEFGVCASGAMTAAEPAAAGDLLAVPAMTPAALAATPQYTDDHECEAVGPKDGRCDAGGCLGSDGEVLQ